MKCSVCEDCGWVCEDHPDRPFQGEHARDCGGAGAPCPRCNASDDEPRAEGLRTEFEEGMASVKIRKVQRGRARWSQA